MATPIGTSNRVDHPRGFHFPERPLVGYRHGRGGGHPYRTGDRIRVMARGPRNEYDEVTPPPPSK